MGERESQALLRFARVLISAIIAAVATAAPELIDVFVLDPTTRAIAFIALTAFIESVWKLIGGPTEDVVLEAQEEGRRGAVVKRRPSFWSV